MMRNSLTRWIDREARRIDKARLLLEPAVKGGHGIWADLGCGDGVFTYLLCLLLQPGSQIYAVDKKQSALHTLRRHLAENQIAVPVHTIHADFTRPLSLPPLDGLVMANTLHFVKKKKPILAQLLTLLKPGGRLIVIEYNTNRGNFAVPQPLDEGGFLTLAQEVGLNTPQIIAKAPSTFLGEMYAGMGKAPTILHKTQ